MYETRNEQTKAETNGTNKFLNHLTYQTIEKIIEPINQSENKRKVQAERPTSTLKYEEF